MRNSTSGFIVLAFAGLIALSSCFKRSEDDAWQPTKDIELMTYLDTNDEGKVYVNVIYENIGIDTIQRLKHEIIMEHKDGHVDTVERNIVLPVVLRPTQRHLVPRKIGEQTAEDLVYVRPGRVWAVKAPRVDESPAK